MRSGSASWGNARKPLPGRKGLAIGTAVLAAQGLAPLIAKPPHSRQFGPVAPSSSRRAKVKAARRQARKNRKKK